MYNPYSFVMVGKWLLMDKNKLEKALGFPMGLE